MDRQHRTATLHHNCRDLLTKCNQPHPFNHQRVLHTEDAVEEVQECGTHLVDLSLHHDDCRLTFGLLLHFCEPVHG